MANIKDLKKGSPVKLSKLSKDERKTQPPGRYSEPALVKALADLGIGRPSTFSSIVSLIQDRGYVVKKGSQLYPTALGFAVGRILAAKFPDFTAYDYTASMEEELEKIASGEIKGKDFLKNFWHGNKGFSKHLESLINSIDFKELEQYSTIDLGHQYKIRFTRFGVFLEDSEGKPNDKGYLPSVKIDDNADVWDYKDIEVCKAAFEKAANQLGPRELGVLESGEYAGWTLWAKDGKFGPFLQAIHPEQVAAEAKGKKPGKDVPTPINHPLREGEDLETITLETASPRFAEVKLPRWSQDKLWLTGAGRKGNYIGHRKSVKGRPVFRKLEEDYDPRTITFEKVKELWEEGDKAKFEKEAAAAAKKTAPKKAPAKKPAAKKSSKK